MKEIPLTQGKVAIVDDADFDWLNQWKWYYLGTRIGYAATSIKKGDKWLNLLMHRLILNFPQNLQVDHINHNGLDNRRNNLRACTNSQNLENSNLRKNNTTGYKGVHKDKYKFRAQLTYRRKKIHIGNYDTVEEASQAYIQKAQELFGEFAYTGD